MNTHGYVCGKSPTFFILGTSSIETRRVSSRMVDGIPHGSPDSGKSPEDKVNLHQTIGRGP